MEEVSRRAYGALHGVTRQTIADAIRAGAIPLGPSGGIDRVRADATWGARHRQRTAQSQNRQTARAERRRERALLQTLIAKIHIARHQVRRLQAELVDRNQAQAKISGIIARLYEMLPTIVDNVDEAYKPMMRDALDLIVTDFGDLHAEALKVTREDSAPLPRAHGGAGRTEIQSSAILAGQDVEVDKAAKRTTIHFGPLPDSDSGPAYSRGSARTRKSSRAEVGLAAVKQGGYCEELKFAS